MLRAKLSVLPILPWTFSLITSLAIEAAEQAPMAETNPAKAIAIGAGDAAKQQFSPPLSSTKNVSTEKIAAKAQGAKSQEPPKTEKTNQKAPDQEPTAAAEKPPSILQMLEGHE